MTAQAGRALDPPFGADIGVMLITTLFVQIWRFCMLTNRREDG
jgi:hypothetical protein